MTTLSYYIIPKGRSSYLRFVNEDFVIYGAGRELVDGKFAIYRVGGTFRDSSSTELRESS